ncbi:MAG: peptidoglycan-binding protein [Leptolyngbyaceae cyanobacterium bins.302]|nr:peptidoglycan-binding protein [Leptolyngbyaceae cyanobacterium bins.302]
MVSTTQTELPILQRGAQGSAVVKLQKLIVRFFGDLGYEEDRLQVDGIFGAITEGAVKEIQERFFLVVNGTVGAKTWNALMARENAELPVLRQGSNHKELVRRVQQRLAFNNYYPLTVDGSFGFRMEHYVQQFQTDHHLVADGVIGRNTWKALSYLYPYGRFV